MKMNTEIRQARVEIVTVNKVRYTVFFRVDGKIFIRVDNNIAGHKQTVIAHTRYDKELIKAIKSRLAARVKISARPEKPVFDIIKQVDVSAAAIITPVFNAYGSKIASWVVNKIDEIDRIEAIKNNESWVKSVNNIWPDTELPNISERVKAYLLSLIEKYIKLRNESVNQWQAEIKMNQMIVENPTESTLAIYGPERLFTGRTMFSKSFNLLDSTEPVKTEKIRKIIIPLPTNSDCNLHSFISKAYSEDIANRVNEIAVSIRKNEIRNPYTCKIENTTKQVRDHLISTLLTFLENKFNPVAVKPVFNKKRKPVKIRRAVMTGRI